MIEIRSTLEFIIVAIEITLRASGMPGKTLIISKPLRSTIPDKSGDGGGSYKPANELAVSGHKTTLINSNRNSEL
jgi:hypothetical protein